MRRLLSLLMHSLISPALPFSHYPIPSLQHIPHTYSPNLLRKHSTATRQVKSPLKPHRKFSKHTPTWSVKLKGKPLEPCVRLITCLGRIYNRFKHGECESLAHHRPHASSILIVEPAHEIHELRPEGQSPGRIHLDRRPQRGPLKNKGR